MFNPPATAMQTTDSFPASSSAVATAVAATAPRPATRPVTRHRRTCPVHRFVQRAACCVLIAGAALLGSAAQAHGGDPAGASAASAFSLSLPVAVVASAPVAILAGGAVLTVVAVQASATGTVWVLERASDGARVVLRFSGQMAQGASAGVGAAVLVTAMSAGVLLSAAGELLCFVPNPIGASLLYNERIDL